MNVRNKLVIRLSDMINNALLAKYDFTGDKSITYTELTHYMNAVIECCRFNELPIYLSFLNDDTDNTKQLKEFEKYQKDHPLRVVTNPGQVPVLRLITSSMKNFRKEALCNTTEELFNIYRSGLVLNTLGIKIPMQ